jgi:hypothetical protein
MGCGASPTTGLPDLPSRTEQPDGAAATSPTHADVPGALVPHATPSSPRPRTHVLDTSVLLADPGCLARFDEHEVVLPIVVLTELEGKRHHPELGFFCARSSASASSTAR